MNRATRLATGSLLGVVLAVTSTACSGPGDLNISNNGPDDVTVVIGDGEAVTVYADGGVAILGYGCTPADVTVTFASGREVVLPGPVCSDQQITIGDDTATLGLVSSDNT
ncbi:hypothetical protein D9V29_14160 [Mycetocola manganoxydans]|uniref:Uncharacterized protein n=1 Tax=Mycetocola manganoxydans TaxID=699879 RepID=A0A3L6ZKX8_9MICO|nr:hypothetical protein [Mycetocola manganoxydans]RLP68171.1 hypothetical protein D9V29_14160 [Mycetocola manganoxydans]